LIFYQRPLAQNFALEFVFAGQGKLVFGVKTDGDSLPVGWLIGFNPPQAFSS
jgi:hypothetical protein